MAAVVIVAVVVAVAEEIEPVRQTFKIDFEKVEAESSSWRAYSSSSF